MQSHHIPGQLQRSQPDTNGTPRTEAGFFNSPTTYELPWWGLQVGAGLNVVSSRFSSTTPTTAGGVNFFKEAPGYYTINSMIKYPFNEKVSLQCNIYNITNNKFYDQLHPSHVVPGAGTTALFTLNFKI